jgi:hypothetical protein
MTPSALDLLATVTTLFAGHISCFNRLGINDAGTGTRFCAGIDPCALPQFVMDLFPKPLLSPQPKIMDENSCP